MMVLVLSLRVNLKQVSHCLSVDLSFIVLGGCSSRSPVN